MASILSAKPDFDRVQTMWDHFWRGGAEAPARGGRGVEAGEATRRPREAVLSRAHRQARRADARDHAWLESTTFLAESVPMFGRTSARPVRGLPGHGARVLRGLAGDELGEADHRRLDRFLPVRLDPANRNWSLMLEYSRKLAKHSEGRYPHLRRGSARQR